MIEPIPVNVHPKKRWGLLSFFGAVLNFETAESRRIVVEFKRLVCPLLPNDFDGFKIVHISDLHLTEFSQKEKQLKWILENITPDIVVFTGDFSRNYDFSSTLVCDVVRKIFEDVLDRCSFYVVRGNSDSIELMDKLRSLGLTILNNESIIFMRGGDSICIGGVDDPHHYMDNIDLTFSGVEESAFKVLLAHSPDILLRLKQHKVQLVLAGHTHGGQICFPGLKPFVTKTSIGRKFASGLVSLGGTWLHVNRGIGGIGLRFCCPPEVSFLELSKSNEK